MSRELSDAIETTVIGIVVAVVLVALIVMAGNAIEVSNTMEASKLAWCVDAGRIFVEGNCL